MRCLCGRSEMIRKNVPFFFEETYLGDFQADVCPVCGEVLFTEQASIQIDEMAMKLGVWGRSKLHEVKVEFAVSTSDVAPRTFVEIFGLLDNPKFPVVTASG